LTRLTFARGQLDQPLPRARSTKFQKGPNGSNFLQDSAQLNFSWIPD